MTKQQTWLIHSVLLVVLSSYLNQAWAHGNSSALMHFSEGFGHSLLGADHLAMLFAVGVLAWSSSAGRLWQLPCSFWLAMTVGLHWPLLRAGFAEAGITALLVLTGLTLLSRRRLSTLYLLPWVSFAGYCHGSVHAAELVTHGESTLTFIGLITATVIIHLMGIGAGRYLQQLPRLQTATGLTCVLIGTVLA